MTDALDRFQRPQLQGEAVPAQTDELQRDIEAAGAVGVPDFPKAPAPSLRTKT
jgi:hypothetical protein